MALVGLIEGEWPDRPKRNIFYPSSLLASLGWPTEKDRRGAAEARFLELLQSPLRARDGFDRQPGRRGARGAFDVRRRDPASEAGGQAADSRQSRRTTRWLCAGNVGRDMHAASGTGSSMRRRRRSSRDAGVLDALQVVRTRDASPAVRPETRPDVVRQRARDVSRLSVQVLRAARPPARGRARRRRGHGSAHAGTVRARGVRGVLQTLAGRRAPGDHAGHDRHRADGVSRSRRGVVSARLSDTEAALERTRLLGSSGGRRPRRGRVSHGSRAPVPVVARLLEHRLKDEFTFETAAGPRRLSRCSGKADRIDLLADGTFRLDRLQAWLAAQQGACAAVADLRRCAPSRA